MSNRRYKAPVPVRIPAFDPAPSGRFVSRTLSELRIRGTVIGRLAVWAWVPDPNEHQFTKDLDIAVRREDMPAIRNHLSCSGLSTRELTIGGVNVWVPETGVNVDFIDRTSQFHGDFGPLFAAAIRASRRTVVVGDVELPLVPAEYLVVMKLATGEIDDERDAERVLLYARPRVSSMRRIVRDFLGVGMVARLESFLARVNGRARR